MPFRASFDCLWCGRASTAASGTDLAGWANLCVDCLERAQHNQFLRYRVRTALRERSGGGTEATAAAASPPSAPAVVPDLGREMRDYYAARTPEYDDWYLRHARYSRGPARDLPWHAELDQATAWLDRLPLSGQIVELAAGTGWWSPLLAQKGELSLYDVNPGPLERARERLVAHQLRAHLHVRDAWAEPDRQVDGVFCGFWLSHVPDDRLDEFLALIHRWLRPGGMVAFIESRPDPEAGAVDDDPVGEGGISVRRLADGRRFQVIDVHRSAEQLEAALTRAGFQDAIVDSTSRFFLMGSAVHPGGSRRPMATAISRSVTARTPGHR